MEKGDNFPGVVLRLAHGRPDFVLEAGPAGNHHAADGGGLQMLPRQLIRITIRRVRGQIKEPRLLLRAIFVFVAMRAGPRSTIEKISGLPPAIDRFENAINPAALTPPFFVAPNRIGPRGNHGGCRDSLACRKGRALRWRPRKRRGVPRHQGSREPRRSPAARPPCRIRSMLDGRRESRVEVLPSR